MSTASTDRSGRAPQKLLALLATCALLAACPATAMASSLIDATGARVETVASPQRIVTLMPSLGELAADFAGEQLQRIVGVSEYTDYPPALKKVKSIGPYHRIQLETIVALTPDLILASKDGNSRDEVLHLRELKLPVVVVDTSTFAGVRESIRLVARAMGSPEAGERYVARLDQGLQGIRARQAGRGTSKPPRVLLQVGGDPLVVAGKNSFLHEALETVGAANLYGDLAAAYPRPALEDVVRRNPEIILVLALDDDLTVPRRLAGRWSEHRGIAAVRNGRVSVLRADALLRPTLRLLEGLSLLEKKVSGER